MLIAIILLAALSLLLLLAAIRYRIALTHREATLRQLQSAAQGAEAEAARLQDELNRQSLDRQRSALFESTRARAVRNDLIMEISGLLSSSDTSMAQKLIREQLSLDETAWSDFTARFNLLFDNFTIRLSERHPDLTRTELRLCCYLKMALPSKEIAPLLGVSARSVEMTRYRLRKKLCLAPEDSLADYIQNL